MSATDLVFTDNVPPPLPAATANGWTNENDNLILSGSITPDGSNQFQTTNAVSNYSSTGDFYTDSGAPGNVVLSSIAPRVPPTEYFDGMKARFIALNDAPVGFYPQFRIGSLPFVSLFNPNADPFEEPWFYSGDYIEARYDIGSGFFIATSIPKDKAKAFISFNPLTSTIFNSYNVGSITKNGVGDFDVFFQNEPYTGTDQSIICTNIEDPIIDPYFIYGQNPGGLTDRVKITMFVILGGSNNAMSFFDPTFVSVAIF